MTFVIVKWTGASGRTWTTRVMGGHVRAFLVEVGLIGGTVKSAHAEI